MDNFKENTYLLAGSFTLEERRKIIEDYLTGSLDKSQIWEKYTGSPKEHGNLNRWMKQLGMEPVYLMANHRRARSTIFTKKSVSVLPKEEHTTNKGKKSKEELEREIAELKRELETMKLQAEGYQAMIEIAEKEYKIPIRKKPNTK